MIMSKKIKKKFKSTVNGQDILVIEKEDVWIKAMPLEIPGSGLHIIYSDNKYHHYDIYGENGEHRPIYLEGYSTAGELYVSSGQNVFRIIPGTDIKIIPKDEIPEIITFSSGSIYQVNATAPGYVVYIKKFTEGI